ncbi:Transmembrane protein, partial [Pseudolycoriella hygida]
MDVDYVSFAFAAVVAIGGIIGYVKAQSTPSLIAGLIFGVILAVGAYLNSPKLFSNANSYLLLITCFVLGSFMGCRFYNSKKFMPAGLIALLSTALVIRFIVELILAALNNFFCGSRQNTEGAYTLDFHPTVTVKVLLVFLVASVAPLLQAKNLRCPPEIAANSVFPNRISPSKYFRCTSQRLLESFECSDGELFDPNMLLCHKPRPGRCGCPDTTPCPCPTTTECPCPTCPPTTT